MNRNSLPRWPDQPAVFLDLDGTLLDFALDPREVQVSARLGELLDDLWSATAGAVAFVSGRTLADLDRLLGEGRFPLAAVHGLERRDARGRVSRAGNGNEIDALQETLSDIVERYPEVELEHKGVAIALHYRRRPDLELALVETVENQLRDLATQLKLMRGNRVLEIKPGTGDKGTAISAFMQEAPFSGRIPVFIGDDTTDEDGFRAVNDLDGVSVKVGPGPTQADFRLPDIRSVLAWIGSFVAKSHA